MSIHPSAVIEPGAELGAGVKIGPFAFVGSGAVIGDGCTLGPGAVVHTGTTLGKNCRVHAHAVIGDEPQDLGFKGEPTFVVIGDGCIFREGVTVHRGTAPGSTTVIGNNCFLMSNSHVAHNCHLGNNVILVNGVLLAGHVHVGDRAFFGGNCGIHQFCRVGRLAIVGGMSSISCDVPPFCMTASGQFNELIGLNTVGLKRGGMTPDQRATIKFDYKILFRSGLSLPKAVEQCRALRPDPLTDELCEFVTSSKRGVCRHGPSPASGE